MDYTVDLELYIDEINDSALYIDVNCTEDQYDFFEEFFKTHKIKSYGNHFEEKYLLDFEVGTYIEYYNNFKDLVKLYKHDIINGKTLISFIFSFNNGDKLIVRLSDIRYSLKNTEGICKTILNDNIEKELIFNIDEDDIND